MLEEALELAQALGVPAGLARALVDRVYRKAPGPAQLELQDLLVTTLAVGVVLGLDVEDSAREGVARVTQLAPDQLLRKHQAKIEDGVAEGARTPVVVCTECHQRQGAPSGVGDECPACGEELLVSVEAEWGQHGPN